MLGRFTRGRAFSVLVAATVGLGAILISPATHANATNLCSGSDQPATVCWWRGPRYSGATDGWWSSSLARPSGCQHFYSRLLPSARSVINNGGVAVAFFAGADCHGPMANIGPRSANPDLGFDAHSYSLYIQF
ncbi:peptidase inhibitor family I36 protein [Nocardia nova]